MGGISAHAGLFATATDVAALGAAWLASRKRGSLISRDLAVEATTPRLLGRGLGWDLKSPKDSSAGSHFGPKSFGHLGFTGCSLWVDPVRDLSVALNTNRVHFGRNNLSIREFRPKFHDLLIETVEK
jgi:CubicO group peptidase (beta-lactamase class C family)